MKSTDKTKKNKSSQFFSWPKIIASILSILAIVYTAFWTGVGDSLKESVLNYFRSVEYIDSYITPDYSAEYLNTVDAVKRYAESYENKILNESFSFNTFIENNKSVPVFLTKSTIIIDKLEKTHRPYVYVLGIYNKDQEEFSIYAINNDLVDLKNGLVEISGSIIRKNTNQKEDISEDFLCQAFTGVDTMVLDIKDLKGGEIRRIANYKLDLSFFDDTNFLYLHYCLTESGNSEVLEEAGLGFFAILNDEVGYLYAQGDYEEHSVQRYVVVDVENILSEKKSNLINVVTQTYIEPQSVFNVEYNIFPTESCVLTFHSEIQYTGSDTTIISDQHTQEIYVPLYKTDDLFWYTVRKFIEKYEITDYFYNSNPVIQKEIDYEINNGFNQKADSV